MHERMRRCAVIAGLLWWFAFPFVYLAATHARWVNRCGGRSFSGEFDDCFNDALPVFELMAFPMTLVLAYPFIRFAFSMFGPESDQRSSRWRLAAGSGGVEYFPAFQIASVIGLIWASLHLFSIPLAARYWLFIVYWAVWICWFLLGAYASSPYSQRRRSDVC
jgi:hypothetical protein